MRESIIETISGEEIATMPAGIFKECAAHCRPRLSGWKPPFSC